jgi:ABC-type bacteriocin/lantibiotic exporter with double-glycine peptidase domain
MARIMITHRVSFVLKADRILIMDRGQLADDGDRAMLQARQDSLLSATVKAFGH